MQDPSDGVVDGLAGRVALVTALVAWHVSVEGSIKGNRQRDSRDDPKTGTEKTGNKGVAEPKGKLGSSVGEARDVAVGVSMTALI